MSLRALYLSSGHNYFGHHGQPAGEHPMLAGEMIECVAGRGLLGDRFFDYRPDYKGQITLFSFEVLEELRSELRRPALPEHEDHEPSGPAKQEQCDEAQNHGIRRNAASTAPGEVAATGRFCRAVYTLLTIKREVPREGLFIR